MWHVLDDGHERKRHTILGLKRKARAASAELKHVNTISDSMAEWYASETLESSWWRMAGARGSAVSRT